MRLLLDTHSLVTWCAAPGELSAAQQHAVHTIGETNPALVADISLWEIFVLNSSGRLRLDLPLRDWLTRAVAPPLVRTVEITPEIAHEVALLDEWENRDPADRLIVATARVFAARIVTSDRLIRDSGLVAVV
ncbi:MAG: type II toxin-antitoxin system VapC family toxin [Spirochaetota bacterium]